MKNIFKLRNSNLPKVSKDKMVGAYLPPTLSIYLILYCLAAGRTKTSLILEIFSKWKHGKEKKKVKEDVDYLINEITKKAQHEFNVRKIEHKNDFEDDKDFFFKSYIGDVTRELKLKGLPADIVNKIVEKIKI